MDYVAGQDLARESTTASLKRIAAENGEVHFHGSVHIIRNMGDFSFVLVRLPVGVVQCVWTLGESEFGIDEISEECCAEFFGKANLEERAPNGFEVRLKKVKVLSKPNEQLPVSINKYKMNISLESELPLRPVTLRSTRMRARFQIQEGIVRGFRDFLHSQGFTEIHTPKTAHAAAEGGANVFKLDYFGKRAFLAQSPQFYKQMMVGVYERVFEVGPVFRAEKHNTTRHLNEYVSLDFEMGYINDFTDIMNMETACLKYIFELLKKEYSKQIETLKIKIPEIDKIPAVRFRDGKEMIAAEYNRKIKDPYDLEPEEEQLMGKYFKEKFGSDFVFITHYPSKKRPFYAMDDPEDSKFTLSFDLLFRGMEITTGGQRIHNYDEQVEKIIRKRLDPKDFESYLMIHKYGMPPHGGLGIGLERLCMKLFEDKNIRYDSLFPRDMTRLEP